MFEHSTISLGLTDMILFVVALLCTVILLFLTVWRPSRYDPQKGGTTVTVLVLGDIGRSPRMQYHTLSLLSSGAAVTLIGYLDSPVLPSLKAIPRDRLTVHALTATTPFLTSLPAQYPFLFPIFAPLKAIQQALTLFVALLYHRRSSKYIIVQNPPAIPVLAIAIIVGWLRNSKLVIDWHNLGYSLLALRFPGRGESHPLVRIARFYEYSLARFAHAHLAVTDALAKHLVRHAGLTKPHLPLVLHDRPADLFQPYFQPSHTQGSPSRFDFLKSLDCTASHASSLCAAPPQRTRLLVSPTSWTPDEDFHTLLDALLSYNDLAAANNPTLPTLLTVITGRGPLLPSFLRTLDALNAEGRLTRTPITTAFLPAGDYARLLAAADLGVSLHTSSSGLDLPMKVLDMFGAGCPVAGFSGFEAWGELVREGVNGVGFGSSEGLTGILVRLFARGGKGVGEGERGEFEGIGEGVLVERERERTEYEKIKEGVLLEGKRRWDGEWDSVAKDVFFR
ncbi:MAG: mannosyltransferase [Chrysothrix sp. TS-e1954]|nr:MAG: mannosyltransferase [Chrysothrix sp. TS-e1954]